MDNRLQELRKDTGKSQKDFFNSVVKNELGMDISFRTYQNWEKPSNSIKEESAQKLANYFDVSLGFLLGFGTVKEEIEHSNKLQSEQFSRENNILLELGYILSDRQLDSILNTIHLFHSSNIDYIDKLIEQEDEFVERHLESEYSYFVSKFPSFLEEQKQKFYDALKQRNDPERRAEIQKNLELIKKYQEQNNFNN